MATHKHLLHELLNQDQEPFLLTKYISHKRNKLKKPSPPPPPTTTVNLCKNACFFSFQNTPSDARNSPLKTPIRSSNGIFLQIPAKTASLLLEAALKIQNKETHLKNKNKTFGVFGSFFKRLMKQNRNKKSELIEFEDSNVSVKDILRWDSFSIGRKVRKSLNENRAETEETKNRAETEEEENRGYDLVCCGEIGYTCSSSNGVWSKSNEEKSLDMETSRSGHCCESVEEVVEYVMNKQKLNVDCDCFDRNGFFSESPFRFVLQKSPATSSGCRTPEFSSPLSSPSRHKTEDKENNGGDGVNKFETGEEEEEKEQCSPVSVLDPPFEDSDDCHEKDEEEDDFDLECSYYANVQRTKQQLLDRLRRFEQLAELDPLELEKRMQEEDNEYKTIFEDDNGEEEEDESESHCEENALRDIVCEILCHSSVEERWQDKEALKRLVYDLIKEEEKEVNYSQDMNVVMKRVCKKMDLWKEVKSDTIDMMIEEDFCREEIGWKKNVEETRELVGEVEVAIVCFLVDEFSEELVC